jgi:hypothetical protein
LSLRLRQSGVGGGGGGGGVHCRATEAQLRPTMTLIGRDGTGRGNDAFVCSEAG